MKKLVVLSGAGISAESGISTFRDNGGLWDNYRIEDVATPEAWARNQELVLDFYNQRRKQAYEVKPNAAHYALVELEKHFDVSIITQNVDNLHEVAGSSNVIHLHGELFKSRSTKDPELVYQMDSWELKTGDLCELGSQLRPHIVWFGEEVPMMEKAINVAETADIFLVIGTSLAVYPAAGLVHYVAPGKPIYIIDPAQPDIRLKPNMVFIQEKASTGMEVLTKQYLLSDQ
ncbi:SIR2 family NAD-dependent protein deacylase [Dyadobacter crusticola]|uniref:SIR2 family NAD-dependent protein deacylase n=1 Tax=Dyadobacter crusticola TaxID=292407 RepID=UPI0004E132CA|nr:NAD-dependent deacylase [Dyadobacter crusticola]